MSSSSWSRSTFQTLAVDRFFTPLFQHISEEFPMSKLFSLVKSQCSHYDEIGPSHIKHYCSQEPRKTGYKCRLLSGIPCTWFEERLLPLRLELTPEWQAFLNEADPSSSTHTGELIPLKQCGCGKSFRQRSNRQIKCPVCSKNSARKRSRERTRRYRKKKAA